jgi:hypothetical protein
VRFWHEKVSSPCMKNGLLILICKVALVSLCASFAAACIQSLRIVWSPMWYSWLYRALVYDENIPFLCGFVGLGALIAFPLLWVSLIAFAADKRSSIGAVGVRWMVLFGSCLFLTFCASNIVGVRH